MACGGPYPKTSSLPSPILAETSISGFSIDLITAFVVGGIDNNSRANMYEAIMREIRAMLRELFVIIKLITKLFNFFMFLFELFFEVGLFVNKVSIYIAKDNKRDDKT